MKHATIRVLLLLLCAAQVVFGCSLTPMELRQVSSDLTVVGTHRGKLIAGITIQVVPEKSTEPVFSSTTDVHGTVLIEGLMVGRYHLTASHEDFDAGKEWIEVVAVPDAKTKKRFEFQWADWSYQSREVAGTLTGLVPGNTGSPLMDIVHPRETFFPGVEVSFISCASKRVDNLGAYTASCRRPAFSSHLVTSTRDEARRFLWTRRALSEVLRVLLHSLDDRS